MSHQAVSLSATLRFANLKIQKPIAHTRRIIQRNVGTCRSDPPSLVYFLVKCSGPLAAVVHSPFPRFSHRVRNVPHVVCFTHLSTWSLCRLRRPPHSSVSGMALSRLRIQRGCSLRLSPSKSAGALLMILVYQPPIVLIP